MLRMNFKHRKEKRQQEAKERQEKRNNRSPQEQLKVLDKLLGKNLGAIKERTKLLQLISENKEKKSKKPQKESSIKGLDELMKTKYKFKKGKNEQRAKKKEK